MKILVVGSGGREHALCWKIAQSPKCEKLYCAPGNGGTTELAESVGINSEDISGLLDFAKSKRIDLTVVGPEVPLVSGIVDIFEKEGLKIFGPKGELARIEGSKVYSKELMKSCNVPTADFRVFNDPEEATKYIGFIKPPYVIKADGLCAGKGVVVCKTADDGAMAVRRMMRDKSFGSAAERIIVEDCLIGEEASIIVVSDGKDVVPLASSQDHKRAFDGDRGPNTGGMGAYSPAPVVTDELLAEVMNRVIRPVIDKLKSDGTPYKGALYAGIMFTSKGPYTLEFNARFGDPETQAILPRLKTDIVDIMERSIEGRLGGFSLDWDPRSCVSVVLASGGYPDNYEKGMEIKGIDDVRGMDGVVLFHAGTKSGKRLTDGNNTVLTSGGRVLNVTAMGNDMSGAIENCYNAVGKIHFEKMHYRRDIGHRAVKREGSVKAAQ